MTDLSTESINKKPVKRSHTFILVLDLYITLQIYVHVCSNAINFSSFSFNYLQADDLHGKNSMLIHSSVVLCNHSQLRAHLYQASASMLRWRLRFCSHWKQLSQSRMGLQPFSSNSTVFNENRITIVITALTLTLGVNGPLWRGKKALSPGWIFLFRAQLFHD